MPIIRREFLRLSGMGMMVPSIVNIALAQVQAVPKLTQILRNDLEGQNHVVQETIVSIVEFPPGAAAPWHIHPGAQELLHVIEGSFDRGDRRQGQHAAQGRGSGNHTCRTRSPRAQRERERRRQSAGRPQQSCKGQAADRGGEKIAVSGRDAARRSGHA
jgi:hypothetical protein